MNAGQYNRSAMPNLYAPVDSNPEMARDISGNPTFEAVLQEVNHEREMQAMRYSYVYTLSESIVGQQTLPFNIQIEQGTDFKSLWLTASAFSYDDGQASDFPIPNGLGVTSWAGRGLSVMITDTRSARTLTSGYVPLELLGTPGYGLNFQHPYPFKYFWYRNTKIRFDVRNRDNANRTHRIEIALYGYKLLTPGS